MLSKGDIFRNYRVEKLLQSVGMVHTYLVVHEKDQQQYVLKVLQERFRNVPHIQKSFVGEYKLAQKVQHENLVFIDQVFVKESAVLLEYLQGVTLEEQLRISDKIEPFTALRWAAQVLQALNILHQHRMVHLEVNPANIFLVPAENGLKRAVLMDHGIGYRVHQGSVKPAFPEHSIYYLSPELISNPASTKFRSDIYSLGAVLFEMMSGKRMIAGENEYNVQNAIVQGERQGLKEAAPHVPTSIAMVVEQSLQINPVSRYPTATAFLDALVRAVGGPLIEEDTQKSPEHEEFDFLLEDSEEEDSVLAEDVSLNEEIQRASKRKNSTQKKSSSSTKNVNSKGASEKKDSQENTSDSSGKEEGDQKEDTKRSKVSNGLVVDDIERVEAEVIEDSAVYDIDGNVITLEHSADAWTEAKMIPPKEGGLRIRISPWILWGLAILFLLSFVIGGVQARNRLVRITIEDKPEWGEFSLLWDREKVDTLEFEDLTPGSYSLLVSGGVFEGESCTRCCWERRFELSIPMGFSVENQTISLKEEERGMPRCPTLEENYAFVSIEGGRFKMGSEIEDEDRSEDEIQHYVDISQPFAMGKTEVTQGLYQAVTSLNPARYKGRFHPIETVSWFEAVQFCNDLSIMEGLVPCYEIDANYVGWKAGLSCTGYRLPTEAEWEYAARGGEKSTYAHGNEEDGMWYDKNSRAQTQEVMKKSSNPLGLFDMSGNVSEWAWDYYGDYSIQNYRDPKGPNEGRYRVIRGGDWKHIPRVARVETRQESAPIRRSAYIGFRIVQSLREQTQ